MASPPQHAMTNDAQPVEDCRDYLRTGRCKYGASCKYNHPPNVQNGGGMKAPLDPSEPLFPIRPNEPLCQYYIKHGTCKFGQACKFHHPAQAAGQVMSNGQVVMNVVRQNEPTSPPFMVNSVVADPSGQGLMLQLLPQRPDEPDCIYFLKNGRCKYGATCRYHHPVNFPQQQHARMEKPRRQPLTASDQQKGQKVHYVTQVLHSYPQGQFILADNSTPITFINVDGFNQQGYQIISGAEGMPQYCVPAGTAVTAEHGSSSSSIASFETANEHLGESASAHWNRAKRNGSASNLSGNMIDNRTQNRVYIPHVASEGNMAQNRRLRTASYGSVSDSSAYFDTVTSNMSRTASASSWRSDRSAHDPVQRAQQPQYSVLPDGKVVDLRTLQSRGRPPVLTNPQRRAEPMRRRSGRPGEPDEGFTMMTSALLHMLDTQEEASAENYSEDEYVQASGDYLPSRNTVVDRTMYDRHSMDEGPPGLSRTPSSSRRMQMSSHHSSSEQVDPAMFQRLNLRTNSIQDHNATQYHHAAEIDSSWSPSWHGAMNGRLPDGTTPPMHSLLNPPHPHGSAPGSVHDSDIGLYLP